MRRGRRTFSLPAKANQRSADSLDLSIVLLNYGSTAQMASLRLAPKAKAAVLELKHQFEKKVAAAPVAKAGLAFVWLI